MPPSCPPEIPETEAIVAQISDLHAQPRGALSDRIYGGGHDTVADTERVFAHVRALPRPPDLIVVTGDVAALEGAPEEYAALCEIADAAPAPMLMLPGNHDRRAAMRAALVPVGWVAAGDGPVTFSRDLGRWRAIGLDTLQEGAVHGRLGRAQLDWLDAELAAHGGRPAILFLHHPPFSTGWPFGDPIGCLDGAELADVILSHGTVAAVCCGHLHRPTTVAWAGTQAIIAPAAGRQNVVDLNTPPAQAWSHEPPGYALHALRADERVTSFTLTLAAGPAPA